jgi:hypothetical protein
MFLTVRLPSHLVIFQAIEVLEVRPACSPVYRIPLANPWSEPAVFTVEEKALRDMSKLRRFYSSLGYSSAATIMVFSYAIRGIGHKINTVKAMKLC